jgi:hypothetical protein
VARATPDVRATFITRTYLHLFGALIAFTLIEVALFSSGIAYPMAQAMLGTSWLLVLGGFILVNWFASHVAHRARSLPVQYLALIACIAAQAVVFVPLLAIGFTHAPGAVESAAAVSLVGFLLLSAVAFVTRKDFSFLRGVLVWGGVCALGGIVAAVVFGFALGTWFNVAMIAFAGAAILYDTSNVLHHFSEDRYVAASLELFASVALLFWYVLRLFLSRD